MLKLATNVKELSLKCIVEIWTQEDERTNNDLQNTTQKTKDLSKRICYTSANCHTTVVKHP
jgi:hypothetical protein